jgi:hypothetical protein
VRRRFSRSLETITMREFMYRLRIVVALLFGVLTVAPAAAQVTNTGTIQLVVIN